MSPLPMERPGSADKVYDKDAIADHRAILPKMLLPLDMVTKAIEHSNGKKGTPRGMALQHKRRRVVSNRYGFL